MWMCFLWIFQFPKLIFYLLCTFKKPFNLVLFGFQSTYVKVFCLRFQRRRKIGIFSAKSQHRVQQKLAGCLVSMSLLTHGIQRSTFFFLSLMKRLALLKNERVFGYTFQNRGRRQSSLGDRPKKTEVQTKKKKGADKPHTITAFYLGASCALELHKQCWEGEFTKYLGLFFFRKMTLIIE